MRDQYQRVHVRRVRYHIAYRLCPAQALELLSCPRWKSSSPCFYDSSVSVPTTTSWPGSSFPSTGVTSTKPSAANPGSTTMYSSAPLFATCTLDVPSAPRDSALSGTAVTRPLVDSIGIVRRNEKPSSGADVAPTR